MRKKIILNIRAKFNFLTTVIAIASISLGIYTAQSLSQLLSYKEYDNQLNDIVSKYNDLNRNRYDLFSNFRYNKQFYRSGRSDEYENCLNSFISLGDAIKQLKFNEITEDNNLQENFSFLQKYNNAYSAGFQQCVKKTLFIGNEESGILYELESLLEAAKGLSTDAELKNTIHIFEVNLAKYLLTKDSKWAQSTETLYFVTIDNLDGAIATTEPEVSMDTDLNLEMETDFSFDIDTVLDFSVNTEMVNDNSQLRYILEKYKANYDILERTTSELGSNEKEGLFGLMTVAMKQFENELKQIIETAETIKNKNIKLIIVPLFLLTIFVWLLIILLILYFKKISVRNIDALHNYMKKLSKGTFPKKDLLIENFDEIKEISHEVNTLVEGLKNTTQFAKDIGENKFDTDFSPLSVDDSLGNALLEMRTKMKTARTEEENRKDDDRKRNWSTQGLAKMSEVLRQHTDDLKEFSYEIISNLANYMNANQAGLFIYHEEDEEDQYLELFASYAYNRRKFMQKKVLPGENLVGACALEKQTIHIKKVPADYIEITSGLGETKPHNILIVPLLVEEKLLGVIEIASLKYFESYEVEFVENIGQSIASTLMTVKINNQTAQLLKQAKMQSEAMSAQEEEMRQNMEELQATQEDSARREAEVQGIVNGLNASFLTAELDLDGNILTMNHKFQNLLGINNSQIGKLNYQKLLADEANDAEATKKILFNLRNGITQSRDCQLKHRNRIIWVSDTYAPIYNSSGSIYKVLVISNDITHRVEQEQLLQQNIKEAESKQKKLERQDEIMKRTMDDFKHVRSTNNILSKYLKNSLNLINEFFPTVEINRDLFITQVNNKLHELLNIDETTVVKQNLSVIVELTDDDIAYFNSLNEMFEKSNVVERTLTFKFQGGTKKVDIIFSPVNVVNGVAERISLIIWHVDENEDQHD